MSHSNDDKSYIHHDDLLLSSRRLFPTEIHERSIHVESSSTVNHHQIPTPTNSRNINFMEQDHHHDKNHDHTSKNNINSTTCHNDNHHNNNNKWKGNCILAGTNEQSHNAMEQTKSAPVDNRTKYSCRNHETSKNKNKATMMKTTKTQIARHGNRRKPFDSAPFYTQVKPHITAQKRVRYVHLLEPSNNKAMPKDTSLEGPLLYNRRKKEEAHSGEHDVVNDGDNDGDVAFGKKRVPISLNPIFHPDI
jgi:hypothetical protein